ncbi:hypothetical protein RHOSPDRAFT_36478 [Rhodotorula sp. JG-1b]|nr:hypothetical protein RHOSPDRAFT_36478 [Rhodotorula sp. JG-1b]
MSNPAPVALSRSRASSLSRSSSSNPLHHSHSHSHSQRPTTPLRRISSSSLRALSLSHSASRRSHGGGGGHAAADPGATAGQGGDAVDSLTPRDHHHHHHQEDEAPLVHLAPILAELADSVSDLTSNLDQLELVHARLDGFNDALAAWLLGLRANGYTVDFVEAPTRVNFELSRQREHERAVQEEEERVKALLLLQQGQVARQQQHNVDGSEDEDDGARNRYGGGDNTFVSSGGADASFVSNQGFNDSVPATRGGRGRGGSSVGVRGGRGAAGGARGGARGGAMAGGAAAARKRKEEMANFADPILPLLPIDIREKRRAETEKVLWALRERPNGTTMQDLVASLAAGGPSQTVPQVRINECLLALARAKVVVKAVVKGATTYRLDPNKCAV